MVTNIKMESKTNRATVFLLCLLLFSMVGFVSSIDTFQEGQEVNLTFTCTLNQQIPSPSATYNVTIVDHLNGTILIDNDNALALNNGIFNYNFTFPESGQYIIISACYDGVNNQTAREVVNVTPTGNELNLYDVLVQAFLLCFFLFLMFCFYMIKRQINFEQWLQKIQNKFETVNTPRAVLASVGYFFVKESFMVYFLLLFPIIVLIINLITAYNLGSMDFLVNILMIFYSIGVLIAGVLMFGKFQQFVVDRMEEITNSKWGIRE